MIGRAFFLVCALLPLCWGISVEDLTRCPYAAAPLPLAVRSNTCGDGPRCQISISERIHFEFDTVAPYESEYVTPNLVVVIGQDEEEGYDLIVPVELPEYKGCDNLANGCPIESEDEITWTMDWAWEPTVVEAGESHTIKFTLYDANETQISCFKMDVDVVA